ncbi:AsmA-like C-terminal region-containing protein [uncultured Roseovarius sp.]|uniref:YhdP family protein n=1 Tax=uncultured Roseovarius sp. TaxID=293344 RepID=UPI00259A586B|nr:AsmA-like C-terminal region-containing protein [uncultured Roseovarius sp.]
MNDPLNRTERKSRARRAGPWLLGVLLVVMLATGLALNFAVGREIAAPDWLRSRITDKINRDMDGMSLHFADMAILVDSDWVPRLSLRGVDLRDASGVTLASLSNARSRVALGPLLQGKLQPAEIALSGARLTLRRSADGAVGLTVGEAAPTVEGAPNMAALVGHVDDLLQRPHFAELRVIDADNLSLRYEDARAGRAWSVDGGRVTVTRDGENLTLRGDFALLGARAYATTLEMNYQGRIGHVAGELGVSFEDMPARDIAGQNPALSWLGALDAPISGSVRASVNDSGALSRLSATLDIGAGAVQPHAGAKPVAFSEARTYFTYDPAQQVLRFDEVTVDSQWVKARIDGQAYLVGMEEGWPRELLGQFRVSDLTASPDAYYAQPVTLDAAMMDVRLRMNPFQLSIGQLALSDGEERLLFEGELSAGAEGWRVALDGRRDHLGLERLLELWPLRDVAPKARDWVVENVRRASVSNAQFALRIEPGQRPDLFLGFDYEGLETRFIKEVPHIVGASGHASLFADRFVITADQGHIGAAQGGRIDIAGTSFIIPDVHIKRGPARARIRTDSTITAALSLLDEEPFRFMTKAGMPVTLADGRAQVAGRLDFLLKPDLQPDEVAFDVAGTLRDVRSETLVEGRVLAAPELTLRAANDGLSIEGEGRIGRVPVTALWSSALGPEGGGESHLTGDIELSERFADEFGIGLPPGSLSGAGRADIDITLQRGAPGAFELRSDLAGVGLALPALGWSFAQGARGDLEVTGQLGQPPQIDRIALDAGGLQAQGDVVLNADGTLERARFNRVRLQEWFSAPVELVGRGAARVPQILVSGGTLDLRKSSFGPRAGGGGGGSSSDSAQRAGPVSLVLDRLQISDGIALTGFRADFDMSKGTSGSFTGRVNGGPAVQGAISPKAGDSAIRILSGDAGGVMAAAGLLKQARDGRMDLALVPTGQTGVYDGQLTVRNVRLKDAPAMAELLNAISVIGLLEQLSGEGIHFSEVIARFKLTPDHLTLLSGSAVGASMGISMDGYYDLNSGRMDMQGVVSPFFMLNGMGGLFTRRGEGLVGMNYALRGTAANPDVDVNPLSVLTPGVFRQLFRRPPPGEDGPGTPALQENDR